ncbi:MAG: hypothetical protein ACI3W5_16255 [Faecousia sp.]
MTFRKNSLLFYQRTVFCGLFVLLFLVLIPLYGLGLSLLCAFPFVVLVLVSPLLEKECITINEDGIKCHKLGTQLWAFKWNEIAGLRRSSRFLLSSIEVITYSKSGKPEPFGTYDHYFQLGKKARKAVNQYYKPIVELPNQQQTEQHKQASSLDTHGTCQEHS